MNSEKQEQDAEKLALIERQVNGVVSGLSPMRRAFLIGYLFHGNATQAAEEAGYSSPHSQGPRMRKHPLILAAIDEFFHAQEMPAREVVARLSQQARAEYADYLSVDRNGDAVLDLESLLAAGKGHLIKEITYARVGKDDYKQVVKFYDAHQALVDVGRYHGLFTDKHEHQLIGKVDVRELSDEDLQAIVKAKG